MVISPKEMNLLTTAEKLFAQKGFEATTTREISAEAQANISMISYYFGSKEKLLEKIFQYRMSEGFAFSQSILQNPDLDAWEKLTSIIRLHAGRVYRLKNFFRIVQTEQLLNKNQQILDIMENFKKGMLAALEDILEEGRREKLFTREINPAFFHATIVGSIFYSYNNKKLYQQSLAATDIESYRTELEDYLINLTKVLIGYEK